MNDQQTPRGVANLSLSQAILYGTLASGVLDALDGVIYYGFQGKNPIQVLQYIASGLLGASAFKGGLVTAGAGACIHFAIALVVTAIYVFVSRRLRILREAPVVCGLLFGAAVNLSMTFLVLPMTAVERSAVTIADFLNGVVGHALLVGLPIAYFASKVRIP